jgi:sulfite reductase (ferredoxin)
LGQPLGAISAHDVPLFVEEVLHDFLKKKDLYNKFTEYTSNEGKGFIVQRLKELHDIPSFEEDKNYYFDWGAKEIFSLTSHGKAECSAGLFDMIDIDKAYIEDNRTKLSKAKNNTEREKYLYDIVFSASRMLLITRGVEPRNEEEVFQQFSELFITQKLVDAKFQKVIDAASKKDPLDALEQDILELGDAIIALYGTIDDSLQFKLPTQNTDSPIVEKADIQETGKRSPITVKDFRGVVCPINFVKTKIALAPLKSGDLLEVWIDDGQPIENVPGSVRNEGHEILSTLQVDDYWKVLIKKK